MSKPLPLSKAEKYNRRKVVTDTHEYNRHRDEYEQTGSVEAFRHMIESIKVVDTHTVVTES